MEAIFAFLVPITATRRRLNYLIGHFKMRESKITLFLTKIFVFTFGQKLLTKGKRIPFGSEKLDESRKFATRLFEFRTGNVCTRIEEKAKNDRTGRRKHGEERSHVGYTWGHLHARHGKMFAEQFLPP